MADINRNRWPISPECALVDGQLIRDCSGPSYNIVCATFWDLYDTSYHRQTTHTFTGFGAGKHILTIIAKGLNRFGQTDPNQTRIDVDAISSSGIASTSFNRQMVGAYADAYADNDNWNFPPKNPADDCTNYVSYSMHAAQYENAAYNGLPYYLCDGLNCYNYDNDHEWWFNSSQGIHYTTYSWGGLPNLLTFTNYIGLWNYYAYYSNLGSLRSGDIVFYALNGDGVIDHSRIVSGWGYISNYSIDYLGSTDRSYELTYTLLTNNHSGYRWHVPINYSLSADSLIATIAHMRP